MRTPPEAPPAGWEAWDADLFDGRVLREYGWTIAYVDNLEPDERVRLARIWATESLTRDAEQYLSQHARGQASAMRYVETLREPKPDEGG